MKQTFAPHYPGLDVLRGVGALLVLLFHEAQPFTERTIFSHGYLAVDMFFMVSGFVLAARFEHALSTRTLSPSRYMIRRIRRLYPIFAVGVLLGLCVATTGLVPCGPLGQEALAHLLIIPTLSGGFLFALNPALWSVFAELWVNLIHATIAPLLTTWLLVLLVIALGSSLALGIFIQGGADVGAGASTLCLGLMRTAFGFLVGVLSWRWKTRGPEWMRTHRGFAVFFLFVVMGAGLIDDSHGIVDMTAILSFIIILKLAAGAQLEGVNAKLATYAARVSFPLYAINYPMIFLARHFIDATAPAPGPLISYAVVTVLLVLVAGLIAAFPQWFRLPNVRSERSSPNIEAAGAMDCLLASK
jgi:peptidoglycan/LPS O-acetylase OafA/YrhL